MFNGLKSYHETATDSKAFQFYHFSDFTDP
jgi:hypothetical protein